MSEGPREGEGGNIVQRITAAAATTAVAASLAACEPAPEDHTAARTPSDVVPAERQKMEADRALWEMRATRLRAHAENIRAFIEAAGSATGRFFQDPYADTLQNIEIELNECASLCSHTSTGNSQLLEEKLENLQNISELRPAGSVLEGDAQIWRAVEEFRTDSYDLATLLLTEIGEKK